MKILLIVGAIATAFSLLSEAVSLAVPPLGDDQELGDNPFGAAVMLIVFLFALLELVIYVTTVVFFCVWLYRAADNLRALNPANQPEYSPGWAVGSFFVPFANLIIPYRAVREVWQKSSPPNEFLLAEPGPPTYFPTWWLFWLLAGFAGNVSLRLSFNEHIDVQTATIISIVASALSIVAAVFAYLVVDAIDKKQEETSAKVNLGKFSGPPPPPDYQPFVQNNF